MTLRKSISVFLSAIAGFAAMTLTSAPADAGCRIEPFGDSITAGVGSTPFTAGRARGAGYRAWLDYAPPVVDLELVGARDDEVPETLPTGYGFLYDSGAGDWAQPYHSGVPGWRIDELNAVVSAGYALKPSSAAPHIVLVHAGTNDILQGASSAVASWRLEQLLKAVAQRYPAAKVIVAKILPLAGIHAGLNATVTTYNNGSVYPYVQSVAQTVAKLNATYPGKFSVADMNTNYWTGYLADGIHPSDYGYADMAVRWSVAIKNIAASAGCTAL